MQMEAGLNRSVVGSVLSWKELRYMGQMDLLWKPSLVLTHRRVFGNVSPQYVSV